MIEGRRMFTPPVDEDPPEMPGYKARLYRSPIDLPEGRSGKVHVRHRIVEPGGELPVVGWRQAVTRGQRPSAVTLDRRMVVHELSHEDRGVWMTDLPEELNQIGEMLHDVDPRGDVLVGGLGLGIMATTLAQRVDVDSVTVVEIDPDVVRLCARDGYRVETQDIMTYLSTSPRRHDYYLLDTWQGTSESTWWGTVMPLKRIIRRRWGRHPVVHCWAEDIMAGQIMRCLTGPNRHWYYDGLPPMNVLRARRFVTDVGLPAWEKKYGAIVDANTRRER